MSRGDECQPYVIEYQQGNKDAFSEIIKCVEPMIGQLIKPYTMYCEYDDLTQTAQMAVLQGLASYDVNRGALFTTYIYRVIKNELLRYGRSQGKHKSKLDSEGKLLYTVTSLNKVSQYGATMDIIEFIDLMEDENVHVEKDVIVSTSKQIIENIVNTYPEKTKAIINLYLGGTRQCDIADSCNVSKQYVCKVIKSFYDRCTAVINSKQ